MEAEILDRIAFSIDADSIAATLRIKKSSSFYDEFLRIVEAASSIANPKAIYKMCFIDSFGDDFVVVDGVAFNSRVLSVNISQSHRVFPFTATCGVELHAWAASFDDLLFRFYADSICGLALITALKALEKHIENKFGLSKSSFIEPGSLEDWPVTEQKKLFSLLGDTKSAVGVELLESCLMIPIKTISGIRFPSEKDFETCQLCPRDKCPGRRAAYDKDAFDRDYGLKKL